MCVRAVLRLATHFSGSSDGGQLALVVFGSGGAERRVAGAHGPAAVTVRAGAGGTCDAGAAAGSHSIAGVERVGDVARPAGGPANFWMLQTGRRLRKP